MANRERGEVTVEAGGQTYVLVFSLNAMAFLEDAVSPTDGEPVSWADFVEKLIRAQGKKKPIARDIRLFLHACLQNKHPELTLEQAGDVAGYLGTPQAVIDLVNRLITSTQPDAADVSPRADPRTAQRRHAGTGATSSSKRAGSA